MLFKNESKERVYVAIGKGFWVKPGDETDIPDGYAKPRRAPNGSRRQSVIEELAPQMRPANDAELAEWLSAPKPKIPGAGAGMPTVAGLMASGIPQGKAELIVREAFEAALNELPPNPSQEVKTRKPKEVKEAP